MATMNVSDLTEQLRETIQAAQELLDRLERAKKASGPWVEYARIITDNMYEFELMLAEATQFIDYHQGAVAYRITIEIIEGDPTKEPPLYKRGDVVVADGQEYKVMRITDWGKLFEPGDWAYWVDCEKGMTIVSQSRIDKDEAQS